MGGLFYFETTAVPAGRQTQKQSLDLFFISVSLDSSVVFSFTYSRVDFVADQDSQPINFQLE